MATRKPKQHKTPKPAREPIPPEDCRSIVFCVRITPREQRAMDREAIAADLSRRDWALRQLFRGVEID